MIKLAKTLLIVFLVIVFGGVAAMVGVSMIRPTLSRDAVRLEAGQLNSDGEVLVNDKAGVGPPRTGVPASTAYGDVRPRYWRRK